MSYPGNYTPRPINYYDQRVQTVIVNPIAQPRPKDWGDTPAGRRAAAAGLTQAQYFAQTLESMRRTQKIARQKARQEAHPILYPIGQGLLAVLKVLWVIIKALLLIYLAVRIFDGLHDVEQTFAGPNSIANTNANVNRYIAQQQQQRQPGRVL